MGFCIKHGPFGLDLKAPSQRLQALQKLMADRVFACALGLLLGVSRRFVTADLLVASIPTSAKYKVAGART